MRVICPFTTIDMATEFTLNHIVDRNRLSVELVRIEPEDVGGYYTAIAREWSSGSGFIVVEQDIVPWPGAMEEMEACHHYVCNFWTSSGPTSNGGFSLGYGLGCTKFSTQLVRQLPDFIEKLDEKHWTHLDGVILEGLTHAGYSQHFHTPPVTHLCRKRFP